MMSFPQPEFVILARTIVEIQNLLVNSVPLVRKRRYRRGGHPNHAVLQSISRYTSRKKNRRELVVGEVILFWAKKNRI